MNEKEKAWPKKLKNGVIEKEAHATENCATRKTNLL